MSTQSFKFPTPQTAFYKIEEGYQNPSTGQDAVCCVYVEVDFENKMYKILDYKKRPHFVFHNSGYSYRWDVIGNLIKRAKDLGDALIKQCNETKE